MSDLKPIVLDKFIPLATIEIWNPRWHDKRVLLSKAKVDAAKTKYLKIIFTKAPSLVGNWVIDRTTVKRYKIESNGSIPCYSVPLELFRPLEINERSELALW